MATVWKTGTVDVTDASATVTGTGTGWATAGVTGGIIVVNGYAAIIESVESETSLTLAQAWAGGTDTGAGYAISRESAAASSVVGVHDKLSQALIRLSLAGIIPNNSGDLTKRDALSLDSGDENYLYLYAEPDEDLAWYRWDGTAWEGPYPYRGTAGADSTIPGPAGEGFTPSGAWDSVTTYETGYFVSYSGRNFVSLQDSNLNNTPPTSDADDSFWQFIPVANGKTILNGTIDPTTEGVDGDFYINTVSSTIFGPKASGTWPSGTSIIGADGTGAGILMNFDTSTTDADPGSGDIRANNASLAAATELYISKTSRAASDISAYLSSFDDSTNTIKGTLVITDTASEEQAFFRVLSLTDATGYVKVGVSTHSGETAFANGLPLAIQFTRAGDKGTDGAGTGDMQASTYDPNTVAGDAFDMDNMVEGATNKILTAAERTKVGYLTVTASVDLDAIKARVTDLDAAVILRGSWDASVGTFPGSGTAQAGDSYVISVGGTVGGVVFTANDRIVALTDNASTTVYASNWLKLDYTDQFLSLDGQTGATTLGAIIAGLTAKTTPVDADTFVLADSAASNASKKVTWANIKATLASTFAALAGSISQAFSVSQLEVGHASDTTLARVSAGVLSVEGKRLLDGSTQNQPVSGGATVTSLALNGGSAVTSGTLTLDVGDCPLQHYTANGAHTLAPGTVVGACMVDITNGASAGAITTSGFTKVSGSFTTTNGHKFRCHVSVGNAGSLLIIQAMQ